MHLKGKIVFTGKMQLCNGWEIRPFAVQVAEGIYSRGISAREHRACSNALKMITLDSTCMNKDEALTMAMLQSHQVAYGAKAG